MLQSLIFAAPTFLVSTCVTPTIKCTETSIVHVLSQDAISILVPMYFKKLDSKKINLILGQKLSFENYVGAQPPSQGSFLSIAL